MADVAVSPDADNAVTFLQAINFRLASLSVPHTIGLLLVTRMRYFDEALGLEGMVAAMVPELAVLFNIPIAVDENKKLPVLSESSAVYTLPALNTPMEVNGTFTVASGQNGEPVMVPVVIA